jgi:Protein of unknown function (DUF4235)
MPKATRGYIPAMARFLFAPLGIIGGLIAGLLAKKTFEQLWGLIDQEEPPESEHREISIPKLLLAGALQGAIFRAVKEASDHYTRRAFAGATGTWPGAERPDPE